jgi:hypothetical protein
MSDRTPTRRALLRYCGVGSMVGLAGCLWGNDDETQNGDETDQTPVDGTTPTPDSPATPTPGDNGGESINYAEAFELAGDGAAPFRNWVVPDNPQGSVSGVTAVCAYQDFEIARQQEISALQQYRGALANQYGTDTESLTGQLLVGEPNGSGDRVIHLGDFDTEAMTEHFKSQDIMSLIEEYRGYSVFEQRDGNRTVVGPDAVIRVPIYEQYIDANMGDADRLVDVDEDVQNLFSVLPSALQISIARHDDLDDLAINGSARHNLDEDGNPNRTTRAFVFHDEESATTERGREIISSGDTGFDEILTEEEHGRMVMIEFIADWVTSTHTVVRD